MTQVTYHTIPIINQIEVGGNKEMQMLLKVRHKNDSLLLNLANKYGLYCSIKYIYVKDTLVWIKTLLKNISFNNFLFCGLDDHLPR